jgi:hypothetical protein
MAVGRPRILAATGAREMKKLKLDVEALAVVSFETRAEQGVGTVEAHELAWTKYPCRSIDIGCISDPTTCGPTYFCDK